MKKLLASFLLIIVPLISANVAAKPPANQLGVCFADSLNGKERKILAKWIYMGMAAHPEIAQYSNVSNSDREETDKYVGHLMTRLITNDCSDQFKAVMDRNGVQAIQAAFGVVGQVAMRELMADKSVSNSLTNYSKYLDKDKIRALDNK